MVTCDQFPIQSQNIFLWVKSWRQEWKNDYEDKDAKKENIIE